MRPRPTPLMWVAALIGLAITGVGVWALLAPRSFYDGIATYPPYNEHLLHDIGAFQIGLGVGLLAVLVVADVLVLALLANSAAALAHAYSHILDRDLGGASSDPWTLSGLALVLVVVTVVAVLRRGSGRRRPDLV